jgi:branched-chain amino acid transport system substrate-binding protein
MKRRFTMVLVSALVTGLILTGSATAQQPVKIGFAHVFSGGMATFGQVAKQGAEMAVREINDQGGILGRPVQIVPGDTAVKPDIAKKSIRGLVLDEDVDIVIGIVSSAVAKAVTPMMSELQCPLIVTHAMAQELTGVLHNPWTFRMTWNVDQCYKASALLAQDLGVTTWTTVGPDYGFGQQSWKFFKKHLGMLGSYTFDTGYFVPMSTQEWTPVIQKIKDSPADAIMISLWGNNLKDFLEQAKKADLFSAKKAICPVGGSVEIFTALGFLDMPTGVWFGAPYWYEAYDNSANRKFIADYKTLSHARIPPSYAAYNAYAAVKMFKAAAEKAGSTDKDAVAKALSGLTVHGLPVGTTTFRAEDHQAIFDIAFGVTATKAAKGSTRIRGLDPVRLFAGIEVTPPVQQAQNE